MKFIFIAISLFLITNTSNTVRYNYPTPIKTKERLFYIQRNLNSNTIVYDAKFDMHGNLNEDSPIDVYWIRYDENGQRMELRKIEKTLAFGIEFSKHENIQNQYLINIVAEKSKNIILKQTAPFEARAYLEIDNKMSEICYLYLEAIDGIIPELKSIEYFGIDTLTLQNTYEKVLY